ncbi:MAG: hypothetical protein HC814_02360, partial [Rhodobacteraceae bacterium]|nr:hypothetical protein [Paracoccaceae bacterium]
LWVGEFDTSGGQNVIFQRGNDLVWTNLFAGPITNAVMQFVTDDPDVVHQHRVQVLDEVLPPPFLSRDDSGLTANQTFRVGIAGIPAQEFVLWSTTNLFDWIPLATNSCVERVFLYSETNTDSVPARAYRVTTPPPSPVPPVD